MASSYDLKQDQHLADLDTEVRNLRKRIQSNVRTINKIANDLNGRLAALDKSGQSAPPAHPPSRRAPRGRGGKPHGPRRKITPKGVKSK